MRLLPFIALLILCVSSSRAQTYLIDFDVDPDNNPLVAGTTNFQSEAPYANIFGGGLGIHFSTDRPATNPLNLYNTELVGGEDDDLERNSTNTGLWQGGNATSLVMNNVLIINDNSNINIPDDEGTGGKIFIDSDLPLISFGFDFADLDSPNNAFIRFYDSSSNTTVSIPFGDLEGGSGSPYENPGAEFGNRFANSIAEITAIELGLMQFNRIEFDLPSSGGIGSIYGTAIPEPSSAVFAALGLWVAFFRRRR